MNMVSELRAAIISLLDQKGALTYSEIRARRVIEALADNEKQIANVLYNLKKAGHIERLGDGRYSLPGNESGREAPEPPPVDDAEGGGQADPGDETGDDSTWYRQDYVQQLLEQQTDAAQNALDAYIMQVVAEHGQRDTLNALMTARDRARDALREVTTE